MERFPAHWHPLAGAFAREAPFPGEKRDFFFYTTYGPRGGYLKMESDYAGDFRPILAGY
ncbi:aromatic prenyltransferase [Actinomadura sp. 9N215]|uniref:aromatic prenyltransferase n=1 Tax=Actinomadura sp. 9N215 TaxID=3375150 RepID=UPI0037944AD6